MLPQRERAPGRFLFRLLGAVLAAAPVVFYALPARAADNSTEIVPADAAFYSASLRNKQQIEAIVNSKAYKRLKDLPAAKMLLKKMHDELGKEKGRIEQFHKFIEARENKELVELGIEAVSSEIFIFGGAGWAPFLSLFGQVNNAQQFASLGALLGGADPSKAQARAVLQVLQKNKAAVKIPELVLGFKIADPKKAEAQIKRLEGLLAEAEKNAPPPLRGRVKRVKVGDSNFLTFSLDGGLIPWDDVPIKDFEDRAGEFDDIVKHLKAAKLTVSLGTREGYLLLALSATPNELANIGGKGKKLIARDELKPLARAVTAKKELTSVGYVSKAFIRSLSGSRGDLDSMATALKGRLAKAGLPEAKKKAIEKDLEAMAKDLKKYSFEPGAGLSFQYLTGSGYEGFAYDYGDHSALKGARLKLLNHFGGNPILAIGIGHKGDGVEGFSTFVKWVKVAYGHAEDMILPNLGANEKDEYEKFTKNFFPLFRKIDETTTKLFLPSLKDGSCGLVVDAKWSSKQWHKEMPPMPKAMPMLELGLLFSLSDSAKFTQAMKTYRQTFNELVEKARESVPNKDNVPEIKIPVADSEKSGTGTLYFWKLPEAAGLDSQLMLTMGVSKTLATFTLSKKHSERLLKNTPLAIKSGPLVEHKKDLIAGCYFNPPALIDAITPWVEFSVQATLASKGGGAPAKKDAGEILKGVRTALDTLKVFESYSSATYLEGSVLVTHHRSVINDR